LLQAGIGILPSMQVKLPIPALIGKHPEMAMFGNNQIQFRCPDDSVKLGPTKDDIFLYENNE
jgi:hypothetical protein